MKQARWWRAAAVAALLLLAAGVRAAAGVLEPLPAWSDLQRLAQTATEDARAGRQPGDDELGAGDRLVQELGLWVPLGNLHQSIDRAGALTVGLVRAIRLPAAVPSWFKTPRDIAGLQDDTPALGARLGIAQHRRPAPRSADAEQAAALAGWANETSIVSLAQPVFRTTLFRDGRRRSVGTFASQEQTTWAGGYAPMCHAYVGGFAHGDADTRLWAGDAERAAANRNPKGSLVAIVTRWPLPGSAARPAVRTVPLDREATGFVRTTQWQFDLDADGRADLVAIEAVGNGPGDIDGPTGTDDAWYRLFFVNIAGRWHLLGHDVFSYGCGC